MRKPLLGIAVLVVVWGLVIASSAVAGAPADEGIFDSSIDEHGMLHRQHGGTDGHLAARQENVQLIGRMRINQDFPGRVSDVGVHGNYAYLGAFNERNCQKGGVYVFDISNPSKPKQINFIRAAADTYVGEGVQVIPLNTAYFQGDLLIHNNEICGAQSKHALGGVTLVDVSNPKTHKWLAEGVGDFDSPAGTSARAHTVHSAFAWQAGDKAYAVLVDNEEAADVDILDITDPRNPVLIAEYDLNAAFPQIVQPDLGTAE